MISKYLKPAILYKEEIEKRICELFYTDELFYYMGYPFNGPIQIDLESEEHYQFAIVNSKGDLLGYVAFRHRRIVNSAENFGLISFVKSPLIGKALNDLLNYVIYELKVHRLEFRMVGGNPVEKHYDRFCEKYNGTKHVYHDTTIDMHNQIHDDICYEIMDPWKLPPVKFTQK